MSERRCDGYALAGRPELEGVTFCRKHGARVVGEILEERDRLKLLLTVSLAIALDMPAGSPDESLARLVEAAHKHGRKLQREEIVATLRDRAKDALNSGTTELENAADVIEATR